MVCLEGGDIAFDGGIIVGYLAAAAGKQVTDRVIGKLLDALARRVSQRLGRGPVDDLARAPHEAPVRLHVKRTIERTAALDPVFARDLATLQDQIDRAGGRQIIGDIYAPYGAVALGHGSTAVGRDYVYAPSYHSDDAAEWGQMPGWTKAGLFIALGGFLFAMSNWAWLGLTDSEHGETGFIVGLFVFFLGGVVAAVGRLVAGFSKGRH